MVVYSGMIVSQLGYMKHNDLMIYVDCRIVLGKGFDKNLNSTENSGKYQFVKKKTVSLGQMITHEGIQTIPSYLGFIL